MFVVPPCSSGSDSFSHEKMPTTMGPTCDDMHILLINEFKSRIKLNLFYSNAIVQFDIFHGHSLKFGIQQNLFHESWSNIQIDMNFQSLNQFKQFSKKEMDLFKSSACWAEIGHSGPTS
jgi:hypothetical protein